MSIAVSPVTHKTLPLVRNFLHENSETSLFLSSNLTSHGPFLDEAMNSGNFKILHEDDKIYGVFCLTRRGNLLAETGGNPDFAPAIIEACRTEPIQIQAVVGEWQLANAIWQILINSGQITTIRTSREPLFRLFLDENANSFPCSSSARLLNPCDFEQWEPLNRAYMQEGGFPIQGSPEQRRAGFEEGISEKCWWGLWDGGTLVAIGCLNAVHEATGQIGGVYTLPERRRCGFARRLLQTLIKDSVQVHGLQKLMLFTGDTNRAAQKLYESLGFHQIGHFALLFGTPQNPQMP